MGTPEYCPLSRRQAITNIIDSVAQEQAALSMILSAEGDKLRRLICTPEVCPEQLLAANRSIEKPSTPFPGWKRSCSPNWSSLRTACVPPAPTTSAALHVLNNGGKGMAFAMPFLHERAGYPPRFW